MKKIIGISLFTSVIVLAGIAMASSRYTRTVGCSGHYERSTDQAMVSLRTDCVKQATDDCNILSGEVVPGTMQYTKQPYKWSHVSKNNGEDAVKFVDAEVSYICAAKKK